MSNILNHILFQLNTEQEVMQFLALGGMSLLDPSQPISPSQELINFLEHRGFEVEEIICWREMLPESEI